jgi:hypothetical protein
MFFRLIIDCQSLLAETVRRGSRLTAYVKPAKSGGVNFGRSALPDGNLAKLSEGFSAPFFAARNNVYEN